MAQFRINYHKVIDQSNQIQNLSFELNSEIRKLEELLELTKSDWCGPAALAFQNQLISLIADMRATKNNITNVSSTIKNVANRIQREDERLAASLTKQQSDSE